MSLAGSVLEILADGKNYSGQELADRLQVTRTAIWKVVNNLKSAGLDILSSKTQGYQIPQGLELLDPARIKASMTAEILNALTQLEIFSSLPSTNTYLLEQAGASGAVCLAEQQTQGRGRLGRDWCSPFSGNIYLSLRWQFADGPAKLSGLSLVIAIAVVKALQSIGVDDVAIKWPNDIVYKGKKLAGILIDIHGESLGPCDAVIGIGVNLRSSTTMSEQIDQPWTSLDKASDKKISRNQLIGFMLNELIEAIKQFQQEGFSSFVEAWCKLDILAEKAVTISRHNKQILGIAKGINTSGDILVEVDGAIQSFNSGEVSIRNQELAPN